jgi:CubicO group peptidase (beta-lactamase class C family)
VDGRPIDQFLREEVCRPLGIEGLYFGVPAEAEPRVATLQNAPGLEPILATFNPSMYDPAATFNRPAVRRAVIPGAGAIVTARALARHYALLAGGGALNGVHLLRPERVAVATRPELEEPDPILSAIFSTAPSRWALGYELGGEPGPMASSPNAFGYAGLGTIGFADPPRRFAFAFLKNRLDWSAREMDAATWVARAVEESLSIG